jgi:hypothetical protein
MGTDMCMCMCMCMCIGIGIGMGMDMCMGMCMCTCMGMGMGMGMGMCVCMCMACTCPCTICTWPCAFAFIVSICMQVRAHERVGPAQTPHTYAWPSHRLPWRRDGGKRGLYCTSGGSTEAMEHDSTMCSTWSVPSLTCSQPTSLPTKKSTNHVPTHPPPSQPTNQSTNQPTNQSFDQSAGQSISQSSRPPSTQGSVSALFPKAMACGSVSASEARNISRSRLSSQQRMPRAVVCPIPVRGAFSVAAACTRLHRLIFRENGTLCLDALLLRGLLVQHVSLRAAVSHHWQDAIFLRRRWRRRLHA